jgi:hypothetical protein
MQNKIVLDTLVHRKKLYISNVGTPAWRNGSNLLSGKYVTSGMNQRLHQYNQVIINTWVHEKQ